MKTWIFYLHTTCGFLVTICLKPCVFTLAFQSLNPLDLSSITRMTRLEKSQRHLLVDLWYLTSRFQKNQENLGMYNQLARWLRVICLMQTHAFWFAYLRQIRAMWHLWRSPILFLCFNQKPNSLPIDPLVYGPLPNTKSYMYDPVLASYWVLTWLSSQLFIYNLSAGSWLFDNWLNW
jgi:hypothetical protein